ncbi:unnamed protein product (plasmid) [Mycetohabitans rhizoxinica HKI 454]|uniref:Uncharacterized protein n=1 Tax=Mycetohabitans rhizoxinica (strain DSM 19002 / CIP 109453 / HKI 454) TaxID=882378 RepID=E5AW84_MYCRK|nr:unnamed protein product [Mycetohabitans rhizoxinica HKI 454]
MTRSCHIGADCIVDAAAAGGEARIAGNVRRRDDHKS